MYIILIIYIVYYNCIMYFISIITFIYLIHSHIYIFFAFLIASINKQLYPTPNFWTEVYIVSSTFKIFPSNFSVFQS